MTIIEAISMVDELKPNSYTQAEKIDWLSRADWMIKRLIIDTHDGWADVTFNGYTESSDLSTEMLADKPYDDMYLYWLESKIDYSNGEYAKYNNSIMKFDEMFSAYRNYYNSTHMPLTATTKYF